MHWLLVGPLVGLLIVAGVLAVRHWVVQPIRQANQRYYAEIESILLTQGIRLGQFNQQQWQEYLDQLKQAVSQGQSSQSFLKGVQLVAEFRYHLPPYYGQNVVAPAEVKPAPTKPARTATSIRAEGV